MNFRNACFADFLNGISLRQIAKSRGVSPRTLERWSRRELWVEKRTAVWQKKRAKILEEFTKLGKQDKLASEKVFELMKDVHAQLQSYMNGDTPRKSLRVTFKDLISLAKAQYHANLADNFYFDSSQK
ncbi:MAG: hypothetical protein ACXWM7_05175 [Parachlamydiaceae bacterium]